MAVAESATEAATTAPNSNGSLIKSEPSSNGGSVASKKKARENDRRRRRRKQKKNNSNKSSALVEAGEASDGGGSGDEDKENADPRREVDASVEVEFVLEKVDLADALLEEFKSVFEKFSFRDSATGEDEEKKDELAANAEAKKNDSDSEEEQDNQQKEKGLSNKKKKLQRRMKIAELKQICTRPDVVEVWDATAADPKLLVFLKSYRNTVPVPRHWCQKRKFLQGTSCNGHGARS